jgi:protein-L-isoaspartate(D-aspartate) O-methyltransferase
MDLNIARFNMVQQQIRPWGVLDTNILDLLSTVPREHFVLPGFEHLAFCDAAIPIGYGQVMLPPKIVGRMLQALQLDNQETILEVGTGTGYMTALLACLAKKVISLEIIPELSQQAGELLKTLESRNIQLEVGDAASGWLPAAPYDVIVFTGSLPYVPTVLREQISIDGRIVAIIGNQPVMSVVLLTRVGKDRWVERRLFETVVPPLINAPQMEQFQF